MHSAVFQVITRRASLMTLGAAGLAALAHSVTTDAKKRKNRNNGDPNKLCKKQVGPCLDFFSPICEDDLRCQALLELCCSELRKCDLNGFLTCTDEAASTAALITPQMIP